MMQSNNNLGIERGQCSFYRNVKVKENVVTTISEFVTLIGKGRWRNEVTRYRQLKEEGRLAEAARIKENLPAVVVAGCCEGAHTKANFRKFSGYAVVDVDDIGGDVRAVLKVLEQQPWTYAGWVSVSGKGIKVVVSLMAGTREEYEQYAYPEVAACVGRLIDLPVDMQCKDLTRMCYASWDEDAFLKEDCEVFPWRERMTRLETASGTVESPSVTGNESTENSHFIEENEVSDETQGKVSKAEGMIARFFQRFCRTHSFVPGSRHDFLLKLGASARRNGMNLDELELLIILAEQTLSAPDYKSGEIRRNITDSYRFTDNNSEEGNPYPGAKVQGDPSTPFRRRNVQDGLTVEEEEREEDKKEQNLKLRLDAPYLPDWIFDMLPSMLTTGLRVVKNKRQRDMLLLAMLTNLSACMPNVKMRYDDDEIYPHLFLAVIASSASGKGIMANATKLSRIIQKEIDKENVELQKEYERSLMSWEIEHSNAMKGKRQTDLDARPEPPLRKTLTVPADMSRSQLIRLLAGSPDGILLNTSELDTLRSAVNAEYGRFDDLMRACFHHEVFGSDFKSDKRAYIVYTPKMAFCGSGTPSQFYRLCPSIENGAYSRYLIYLAEQQADFMLMAPRGETENKSWIFRELSEEVYRMYRYLKGYPTDVTFTSEQWNLHKSFFQGLLQGVRMEEVEGPLSVIFRYGMIAARIAMIFTALRKYEAQWSFRDIACTDDDFLLSLAIIEVLVSHSLMFATSLHKVKQAPTEMRKYFRVRQALEKLKPGFTFTEFVSAFVSMGFSESTAKRYRARLISMNIIEKQGNTYCFTNSMWRAKLERSPLGKV